MSADRTAPLGERQERLQKVLAHAGIASRRRCEEYILQGRVEVNGRVVTALGTQVRPGVDRIKVDGALVTAPEEHVYYLLYKPVGYLSTVRDPHGGRVALDLVPTRKRLYPVGRLDLRSEGLLLFTNDGALAHRMMHPRYQHEKEYLVLVQGWPSDQEIDRLRRGLHLVKGDRPARAHACRLQRGWRWRGEASPRNCHWIRVILREGRKRQIRRMLQALGHPVMRLIRVRVGDLVLGDLHPGQGRWLGVKEADALRRYSAVPGGEEG